MVTGRVSARTAELSIQGADIEASRRKQFVSHFGDRPMTLDGMVSLGFKPNGFLNCIG